MCVSTLGSSSLFGKIVKHNMVNHRNTNVFFWFSLIFVFSLYLPNSSLIAFYPPPGPHGGGGAPGPSAGGPGPHGGGGGPHGAGASGPSAGGPRWP